MPISLNCGLILYLETVQILYIYWNPISRKRCFVSKQGQVLPKIKLVVKHDYILDDTQHNYRKTSNIRHALVGNKIVDHSDVVGASPVGAAPTTSSFST